MQDQSLLLFPMKSNVEDQLSSMPILKNLPFPQTHVLLSLTFGSFTFTENNNIKETVKYSAWVLKFREQLLERGKTFQNYFLLVQKENSKYQVQ